MKHTQNSLLMWAIFIAIVVGMTIIAIPQYTTLSRELHVARARDLAAVLTSATAVNYTQKKLYPGKGVSINNCKDVAIIVGNQLPQGYHITDKEVQAETMTNCALSVPGITEIPFNVIGAS